jgi:hypothetical protein
VRRRREQSAAAFPPACPGREAFARHRTPSTEEASRDGLKPAIAAPGVKMAPETFQSPSSHRPSITSPAAAAASVALHR